MKGFRDFISLIISIGIVAYLIITPNIIKNGIEKGRVSHWENKEESFSGIIELWHIVSFKAHTGSVSTWIASQTKQFEKRHFGIYINITAMTMSEYQTRIDRGERADIYSFPLGLEYSDKFMPLDISNIEETQKIRSGFLGTGEDKNVLYAIPFMYSGYCLMVNNELMQKSGVNIDGTLGSINSALTKLSNNEYQALCGDSIFSCYYGIKSEVSDIENFRSQNAHMAICDFRAVGDAERRHSAGKSFPISTYTLNSYTNLVQYLAFDKDIEPTKINYSYEIIGILLSEKAQGNLSDLNVYPVIALENTDEILKGYGSIAYDAFSVYMEPIIPNSFLYRRHKDTLNQDAIAALTGDKSAELRFKERMNELIQY